MTFSISQQLYLLRIPGKKGEIGVLTNKTAYNKNTFDASFSLITLCSRSDPSTPLLKEVLGFFTVALVGFLNFFQFREKKSVLPNC